MELTSLLQRSPFPIVGSSSLDLVARSFTLRCDAKQAEARFAEFDQWLDTQECFYLGDVLPGVFAKGSQPRYIEDPNATGVPVINTMSIQDMRLVAEHCRLITEDDFDALNDEKKPRPGDVLLTMDGGVSIGKPLCMPESEDAYSIDSHIAILRPDGIDPSLLSILLASPVGQIQFLKAESGASGQTAVTEEDVRRFQFPEISADSARVILDSFSEGRSKLEALRQELASVEAQIWEKLGSQLTG